MDAVANVLFGKTRRAVFALLFDQPGERFYLREIARMTGISTGALQNEMNQLLRADLVCRERDGNRVTYRANTAHPVFEDLQGLVMKTCGVAAQLSTALAPFKDVIDYAVIYGSFAKRGDHARSDVDILVVGTLSLAEVVAALADVESRIGREVSVRLYMPDEYRERLAKGDRFLEAVIQGDRVTLLGIPEHDA